MPQLGATILRKNLDAIPLWRGANHVPVKQLVEDFAQYLYLPRLAEPSVLVRAICDGVKLLTWQSETFAYAESWDDVAGRYRGLQGGQVIHLAPESPGLVVKPDVAWQQMEAEASATIGGGTGGANGGGTGGGKVPSGGDSTWR